MMHERSDGTGYQDEAEQSAVLRPRTNPRSPTTEGLEYHYTLGDLVETMIGARVPGGKEDDPRECESLEEIFVKHTARELRAIAIAVMARRLTTSDDLYLGEWTDDDTIRSLWAITRRMTAGAELSARLRRARWEDDMRQAGWVEAPQSALESEVRDG